MNRIIRGIVGTLSVVTFSIALTQGASAGTGVYIGKDASSDGSIIIAGNADSHPGEGVYVTIVGRQDHENGECLQSKSNNFEYEYPKTTYEYKIVRSMDYVKDGSAYLATNEYGVCVLTAVGADNDVQADYADPVEIDGIGRSDISEVLASSCKTARSATNLLCDIIDEKGAADTYIVMIADQREVWYMEVYSGHQYAAIKMPEDKVAAFGDEYMIGAVDEDADMAIYSPDLFSIPMDNDFAEYEEDGRINLAKTYGDKKSIYNTARTWAGHELLAPTDKLDYDEEGYYDLLFEADSKVSVEDVFMLLRNKFEDADFTGKLEDKEILSSIASDANVESSVIQIYGDLPAEMSNVTWLSAGPCSYSPYVPIMGLVSEIDESYATNLNEDSYENGIAACEYQILNALCTRDNAGVGAGIRQYWEGMEAVYVKTVSDLMHKDILDAYEENPDLSREVANEYCAGVMSESVDKATELFKDGTWHETKNYGSLTEISDVKVIEANYESTAYEPYYDVVSYAQNMGWTVQESEDVITFTRDNEIIVIDIDENTGVIRKYSEDGIEEELEIEEFVQEMSNAPLRDEKKSVNLEKDIDDLDAYFAKKIEDIPKSGWSEREALLEISKMKDELIKLIESYLGKDIDEIDIQDLSTLTDLQSISKYTENMDPEEIAETVTNIGEEAGNIISEYFGISADDIANMIDEDGLSKEEVERLIGGISDDINALLVEYIREEFVGLIDDDLTTEEIYSILKESGSELARIAQEYYDVDLGAMYDVSLDDVVEAIDSLDDETKEALGELLGVDVDDTIKAYKEGTLEVEVNIDVDAEELGLSDEYIEKLNDYFENETELTEDEDIVTTKEAATEEIEDEPAQVEEIQIEPVQLAPVQAESVQEEPVQTEQVELETEPEEVTQVEQAQIETGTVEVEQAQVEQAQVEQAQVEIEQTQVEQGQVDLEVQQEVPETGIQEENPDNADVEYKDVAIKKIGHKIYAPGWTMRLFR